MGLPRDWRYEGGTMKYLILLLGLLTLIIISTPSSSAKTIDDLIQENKVLLDYNVKTYELNFYGKEYIIVRYSNIFPYADHLIIVEKNTFELLDDPKMARKLTHKLAWTIALSKLTREDVENLKRIELEALAIYTATKTVTSSYELIIEHS